MKIITNVFCIDALKAIKEDILVEDAFIKKAFEDARWLEESVAQVHHRQYVMFLFGNSNLALFRPRSNC